MGVLDRFLSRLDRSPRLFAFFLMAPSFIMVLGLMYYPLLYSFFISLHRMNLLHSRGYFPTEFVGLSNYFQAFRDQVFIKGLINTILFAGAGVAIGVPFSFGVALVLNEKFRGNSIARNIPLLPWAIPGVVNVVIWGWILNGQYGALNNLLRQLGIISKPIVWLGDPFWVRVGIILSLLYNTSFPILLFLSALQSIPEEFYEAAKIDGAGAWNRFKNVTIPMMKPVFLTTTALTAMWGINVFTIVFMLTKGSPFNSSMVLIYYLFRQGLEFYEMGYAGAIAFILSLMMMIVAFINIKAMKMEALR